LVVLQAAQAEDVMSCPSTLLLFGSGLLGIALLGLRRRRKPPYQSLSGKLSEKTAQALHAKYLKGRRRFWA
jgi:hypothetical protein